VIERNYTKFFRNSEYRIAVSQAVEKATRKEEKLLLIGLTNQSLLQPWMRILSDTKTPLSGIISLPLLSEDIIGQFPSRSDAKIMVSQEVPSNLRQSVFIGGKLVLSRLVPIASFYQGDYAGDVLRDIESTRRYLVSQRFVDRDGNVSVHILCNKRHREKLEARFAADNLYEYHVHEINQFLDDLKIEVSEEQDFSSALFCYLATKKLSLNHYARKNHTRYFEHHKVNLALTMLAIVSLVAGLAYGSINLIAGISYADREEEARLIEQKYKAKYNQLSEHRIDSTTSTTSMQNIVKTVEDLKQNFIHEPESMMSVISQDISLFSDIRVTRMEWFLSNLSDSEEASEVNWSGKKSRGRNKKKKTDRKKQKSVKGFFEVANVEAEFLEFDGNYRYALSAVDDLEKTMKESGKYFYVEITKRPLDIESDNQLSGDASAVAKSPQKQAGLAFRVVREVKQP